MIKYGKFFVVIIMSFLLLAILKLNNTPFELYDKAVISIVNDKCNSDDYNNYMNINNNNIKYGIYNKSDEEIIKSLSQKVKLITFPQKPIAMEYINVKYVKNNSYDSLYVIIYGDKTLSYIKGKMDLGPSFDNIVFEKIINTDYLTEDIFTVYGEYETNSIELTNSQYNSLVKKIKKTRKYCNGEDSFTEAIDMDRFEGFYFAGSYHDYLNYIGDIEDKDKVRFMFSDLCAYVTKLTEYDYDK